MKVGSIWFGSQRGSWPKALAALLLVVVIAALYSNLAGAATGWTIVASPNRQSAAQSVLASVSCLESASCTAVGYSSDSSSATTKTLIESSSSGTWTIVPSPDPRAAENSQLTGVSCFNPSACIAVGVFYAPSGHTLVESWNGARWARVPSPNPSGAFGSSLQAVSCLSASRCTAVGYYSNGSNLTLIESWNGHRWQIVPSPDPASGVEATLQSVSCSTASSCTAVGDYEVGDGSETLTLVESWNGTSWSIVPSPNPTGAGQSMLVGVLCLNSSDCFAVGSYYEGSWDGLIERWNGTTWSAAESPSPSGVEGLTLAGVSCTSVSACTAVGDYQTTSGLYELVESWNGLQWSTDPSQTPDQSTESILSAVSCRGQSVCTAAGFSAKNALDRTLIEMSPTQ